MNKVEGQGRLSARPNGAEANAVISVLIAVRNNWGQLAACLDSIAGQRGAPPFEVIIVDDGSKDPPPAVMLCKSGVRIIRQTRLGIAAARNHAVRQAAGELLVFVDSDCLLDPLCLRTLDEEARRRAHDVAFQFCLSSPGRTLAQQVEKLRLETVQESLRDADGHISYANTSGFALRAAAVPPARDLFDTGLVRGSDTGLLAGLIRRGRPPVFLPGCRVLHGPEGRFFPHARRHFGVGFEDWHSHCMLDESGGARLGWREKLHAARRIAGGNRARPHVAAAALSCWAIEKAGRAAARLAAIRRGHRRILGVRMEVLRQTELIDRIATSAEVRKGLTVSYANARTLVEAQKSPAFLGAMEAIDVCLVDGVGVKLAAILLGQARVRKITGNNLIFDLARELAARKISMALVGGKEPVLRAAAGLIAAAAPELEIVLRSPGYFPPGGREAVAEELKRFQPGVVLLGLGQPLQEQWATELKSVLPGSVLYCVGGLFDYLAGPRKWADFSRRFGMEWAYRLCRSPRQLAGRYVVGIPALLGYIAADRLKAARRALGRTFHKEDRRPSAT